MHKPLSLSSTDEERLHIKLLMMYLYVSDAHIRVRLAVSVACDKQILCIRCFIYCCRQGSHLAHRHSKGITIADNIL